jgi:hypothetical protein
MTMMIIIIQLNCYLFTCKLNSPKTNYKVITSKEKETKREEKTKNAIYIIIIIIMAMRYD